MLLKNSVMQRLKTALVDYRSTCGIYL